MQKQDLLCILINLILFKVHTKYILSKYILICSYTHLFKKLLKVILLKAILLKVTLIEVILLKLFESVQKLMEMTKTKYHSKRSQYNRN